MVVPNENIELKILSPVFPDRFVHLCKLIQIDVFA